MTNQTHPELSRNRRNDVDDDIVSELFSGVLNRYAPVIHVRGEIDGLMAKKFREAVDDIKNDGAEVAMIEISSPGGCVFSTFEMINAMAASGLDFITYNASHAFSGGAVLLSAGTKGARIAAPYSTAMIHGISTGIRFKGIEDIQAEVEHDARLNEMVLDIVAKGCGCTVAKLKRLIKDSGSRDLYLFPEQMVEIGLVDKISWASMNPVSGFNMNVVEPDGKAPSAAATQAPKRTAKRR